jgi:enoyl-CoA hydratase
MPAFDTAIEMENRQQVLTSATTDQHEAMDAFVAKRAPEYTNR